ncbi:MULTISPECIES: hypothetical protein [Microbacterium]|uniref:Uncharacterized protein n=1 Tax=Microbacterium marmarense TaxID=3122051 RepID=A0ABU8LWK0_9MICO
MAHTPDRDGAGSPTPIDAASGDSFGQYVDASFDEIADGYRLMTSFAEEIENVTASDWDLDADELWGGVEDPADFGPEPGGSAFDFEM